MIVPNAAEIQDMRNAGLSFEPYGLAVIDFINKIAPKYKDIVPAYKSKSHDQLYHSLIDTATELQANKFVDTIGIASYILLGPRGIGKTTSFRNFVQVVSIVCSDVIPVYVSYVDVLSEPILRSKTILEIVELQVNNFGVTSDQSTEYVYLRLFDALTASNKRVLLIIDEMDKLFEVDPFLMNWFETLTRSLGELAKIGDDASGLFACILCGSSVHLPTLVFANGKDNPSFVKHYPLVQVSINLNDSKFRPRRIYTTTTVELDTVASILYNGDNVNEHNRDIVRAITFITGGIAREVSRLSYAAQRVRRHASITQLDVEYSIMANKTLSTQPMAALYDGILDALYTKNKSIMDKLKDIDGSVNMERVSSLPWETQFKPLTYSETEQIWQKTVVAANLTSMQCDLDHCLTHLFDLEYITIASAKNGRPDEVFPYSVLMVARYGMNTEAFVKTTAK